MLFYVVGCFLHKHNKKTHYEICLQRRVSQLLTVSYNRLNEKIQEAELLNDWHYFA